MTAAIQFEEIPLEKIEPNPWNPNQMDEKAFKRLLKAIQEDGFVEPIQVVPHGEKYRILGGEHRYHAMKQLGATHIPAVIILSEKYQGEAGEDACKFLTMKLNCMRGKTKPEKFMSFYQGLSQKYGAEMMQEMMGVTDEDAWKKLMQDAKISIKGALGNIGNEELKKHVLDKFDKESAKAKTVEDLGNIVTKLMGEAGSSLEFGYMIFSYGGKQHIFIQLKRKQQFELIHERLASYKEQGLHAGSVISDLLVGYIPDCSKVDSIEPEDS